MRQIPEPSSDGSPYIPVITYTTDWPTVIIIPNTTMFKNTKKSVQNQQESLITRGMRIGNQKNKAIFKFMLSVW